MKKALFAGSFDPPTKGHLDIIRRACILCDTLYIGIGINAEKKETLFTVEEKKSLLVEITQKLKNVKVVSFSGLIVEFAKEIGVECIFRGLRAFSDLEYEFRMALANRKLSGIETLFLLADEKNSHINSTLIREIIHFKGPLKDFVPDVVEKKIKTLYP